MSLFKIRTFWSTHCSEDEFFDQNSLLVTKLNSESDVVITGSHGGILRIFKPSCELTDSNNLSEYMVTDLLIETILKDPILQVSSGRLVSGSAKIQLAILQPRLLSVYALVTKQGATDHGVQHILQLLYEHKLRRLACNCYVGSFGGTQNRDFICVQSLDGLLTFFEQESFSFCCFLPDFLLPGPLIFVKKSDSFVTSNSSWQVTSYKYKLLSEAGQNSVEDDNSGKKVSGDWKFNLGEALIDLDVVEDPNSKENFVLVLGERNIFCLSDVGKLKYMKRLDFSPICFTNYSLNDRVMSLVVSETNNLLIYQNTSLKWCSQLQTSPISVKRAFMHNVRGVLVLLSEEGLLECCYLGTEPSLFVAPPLAAQDLDFEKAGNELTSLYKTIKNSYSNDFVDNTNTNVSYQCPLVSLIRAYCGVRVSSKSQLCHLKVNFCVKTDLNNTYYFRKWPLTTPAHLYWIPIADIKVTNASAERELSLNVSVSPHLEPSTFDTAIKTAINNQMCAISIEILPQALFEEVQIALLVQYPLKIEPQVEFFNNLSEKTSLNCWVFMCGLGPAASLNLQVVASFISSLGVPRSVTRCAMLPLNLVLETCPPLKESECKVTLGINQSPVGISVLFPEFTFSTSGSAIGFRDAAGGVVTILSAKSSERYRLQSSSFASLSLLIEQMVHRLKKHYANKGDFAVTFNSPLPISEPLQYVGNHFKSRQKVNELQEQLTQLSAQFRLIQKRLISKFKVKNPTPLTKLDLLLSDTFNEIMTTTKTLEEEQDNLLKSQTELSCALHVLLNLVRLTDCNNNIAGLIESVFNPHVYDLEGQSWEDVLDASLCYLLRTALAKSEKDKLRAAHTSFDEVKDVSKIEKHLTQVLERTPRGVLLESHFPAEKDKQDEEDEGDNTESVDAAVPIGSKIGESSSRLLSARKGLLKRRQKLDD